MKVSELSGETLDYWVAQVGRVWTWAHELFPTMTLDPTFKNVEMFKFDGGRSVCRLVPSNPFRQDYEIFAPSTQWQHGGLIIERENISIMTGAEVEWIGCTIFDVYEGRGLNECGGSTPLVAAMRAYVSSKLGKTVPDEIPA